MPCGISDKNVLRIDLITKTIRLEGHCENAWPVAFRFNPLLHYSPQNVPSFAWDAESVISDVDWILTHLEDITNPIQPSRMDFFSQLMWSVLCHLCICVVCVCFCVCFCFWISFKDVTFLRKRNLLDDVIVVVCRFSIATRGCRLTPEASSSWGHQVMLFYRLYWWAASAFDAS